MRADPLRFAGHARDRHRPGQMAGTGGLHLIFPAGAPAVRRALRTTLAALRAMGLNPDAGGLVELILAEVLNNVTEHACATRGHGLVELEVWPAGEILSVRVRDDGIPMPGGAFPPARWPDPAAAPGGLPEGGFGCGIIRKLAGDLAYRRDGTRNELCFTIAPGRLAALN